MIKCLNMKKNLFEKYSAQKNMHYKNFKACLLMRQMIKCQKPNFLYFSMFFQDSRIEIIVWYVCYLIFIFTLFLHEPKKFCALYYTNIVININSRVQTLIYFEKVNSSFWKADNIILQCFLRYYITRYFRVVKIVFVVKDRLVCNFPKKREKISQHQTLK